MNYEPFTSIENPTLAHFRHFSSLFTLSVLYICREPSTNQPFYAKQTQFPKSQMNVNLYNTTDYENISDWTLGENKPNSNPIKPCPERSRMGQFKKSQNERKWLYNKGLQKKRWFRSPKKQTQFKPNFRKAQNERKRFFTKGLWKWNRLQAPEKQTQTNPVLSAVEWANFKPSASLSSFCLLLFSAPAIIWQCRPGQYKSS